MSPTELSRVNVVNTLSNHEKSLDSSSPPSVMRPSGMTQIDALNSSPVVQMDSVRAARDECFTPDH